MNLLNEGKIVQCVQILLGINKWNPRLSRKHQSTIFSFWVACDDTRLGDGIGKGG